MTGVEPVAQLLAERMINCVAEGSVIAGAMWLMLRVVGIRNSRTRFLLWFFALLAVALLPLFTPGNGSSGIGTRFGLSVPGSWSTYLLLIWLAMAIVGLVRLGYGLFYVFHLRRSCRDSEPSDPKLQITIDRIWGGKKQQPRVAVSKSVRVPLAIGFFKPMIILPTWAVQDLSAEELHAVLLHEWAHLQRRDHWTNLVQKVVHTIFFFHPAVWWIEKQILLEREIACDEAVIEQLANARAYAECLVSVAEKSFLRRGLTMVQTAVTWARHTTLRVASILERDKHPVSERRGWNPAFVLISAFSVVFLSVAEYTPLLVRFSQENTMSAGAHVYSASDVPAPAHQAMVMPASVRFSSNAAAPLRVGSLSKYKSQRPHLVLSKRAVSGTENPSRNPMVMRTSVSQSSVPAQTFLVVMRSDGVTNGDSMVWTLTIWKVTVVESEQAVSRSKST